jgi:hypothetical protein
MKYLLLICIEEPVADAPADDDTSDNNQVPAIETWLAETGSRRLLGSPLEAPEHAVTVRTRNGEVILTDGPFAEAKEWIAGFDLIETETIEEAIEIASRHPVAHFGMVEVRRFQPLED